MNADDLPPCDRRPTALSQPWIRVGLACLEQVIDDPGAGDLAFTALAAAPDGSLYATRPFSGEVLLLTDTDGDRLPDTPAVVASGLTLPNALVWHEGSLYILGGRNLYRLDADGTVTTLVDDLPVSPFWVGGVAVLDERVYVTVGAACDSCASLRGRVPLTLGGILSFALDGTDRRIEAFGLRSPGGLVAHHDGLYVTDSAADRWIDTPGLDEVNVLSPDLDRESGGYFDFGFPECIGANQPTYELRICRQDASGAIPPIAALPTGSHPTAIAVYSGAAIPALEGQLLVVLNGSRGRVDLRGYQVVTVDLQSGEVHDLMPARPDDSPSSDFSIMTMNYRGSGFYPRRPIGVTVTGQGWVYISISGGRILALRP